MALRRQEVRAAEATRSRASEAKPMAARPEPRCVALTAGFVAASRGISQADELR